MVVEFKQCEMPIWFEDLSDDKFDKNRIYKLYGKGGTVHWNDFESAATCSPQNYELALAYIKRFIGYFPEKHVYLPHMAFIQIMLEKSEAKLMDVETFWIEMTEQMKLLRNDDMRKSGWVNHVFPCGYQRDFAKIHLAQFADKARVRLSRLLGFEPKVKYSLEAELFLRTLFEEKDFTADLPFGDKDFRAGTAVLYRMHYFEDGEAAADKSELIALKHEVFYDRIISE